MSQRIDCASAGELGELLQGKLPHDRAEVLEQHLLACSACLEAVRQLHQQEQALDPALCPVGRGLSEMPQVDSLVSKVREMATRLTDPGTPPDTLVFARGTTGADTTPDRIADYQIERVLGSGGMGVVYAALDVRLQRPVALKVMKKALAADGPFRERFLREARATAAINHQNIITIYHSGEDGDQLYLAMPLLEGETLQTRITRMHRLPYADILRIARQVADGLAAAHQRGLVHRDIKPANIWLERRPIEGQPEEVTECVKVLDFGLATPLQTDVRLTNPGAVMGTPAYMAPEQARGLEVDPRSDLYGLGAVMYQMCTGQPPFGQRDLISLVAALALDEPRPVRELAPEVPAPLADLVKRLLAKSPEDRPATARAVSEELARLEDARLEEARLGESRLVAARETPRPTSPRRRGLVLVAVACLFLAVGAYFCGPVVYLLATDQGELRITAYDEKVEVIIRKGGKEVEIVDLGSDRRIRLQAGVYEVELSGAAEGLRLSTTSFHLSRGGSRIVSVDRLPPHGVPPVATLPKPAPRAGPFHTLTGHEKSISALALSPGGNLAVSASWDGTVRLWDVVAGKQLALAKVSDKPLLTVSLSPDGKRVAAGGFGREVPVWRIEGDSLKEERTLTNHPGRVKRVQLTGNGRLFAIGQDGLVWAWQSANGRVVLTPDPNMKHLGQVESASVSPDGQRILFGCRDNGSVQLWEIAPTEFDRWFEGHRDAVNEVAFIGTGRTAGTAGGDGTVRIWEVESSKEIRRLTHPNAVRALAFSGDGKRVITGCDDGKVRLWDVERELERQVFPGHRGAISAVALSRDGKTAISAGEDQALRVWALQTYE